METTYMSINREWIKKMWYTYTMEYYSAVKRMEFIETWMELETVLWSEVSQKEKNKYCTLTNTYGFWKDGTDELIFRAAVVMQT